MSRHEGVSCDSCLKGNFRGKRYKCLICYDYDLCATCYEAGATNTRHTTDHPMQCILTRSDFDLYYGGEAISVDQPQSYTCPFCGKMGYTESTLQEHVSSEHSDSSFEVVCPVCASLPGGEPNHVTDDFAAHLSLEHRTPRDLDEPSGSRHVRRIPHPGRGMSSSRARRTQMQFSSTSGLASLSPGSRESMDPIAELLSQLSGVRRTANLAQSTTSQLQQLQMQLQLERQQAARQQLERIPRRQAQSNTTNTNVTSGASATNNSTSNTGAIQSHYTIVLEPSPSPATSASTGSQFLLSRCTEPTLSEAEMQSLESEHANRSLFVQELLMMSLAEQLNIKEDLGCIGSTLGLTYENDFLYSNVHAVPSKGDSSPNLVVNVINSGVGQSCTSSQQQWTSCPQTQQMGQSSHLSHNSQSARNSATRKSPNSSSSTTRQTGRSRGGSSNSNHSQFSREANSQLTTGRGGATSFLQQVPAREGLSGNRQVNRAAGRDANSSPSSTRRKVLRQVDDRNKSSEPPPPH